MLDTCALLSGAPIAIGAPPPFVVTVDSATPSAYRRLRQAVFVDNLGLFDHDDTDEHDRDAATRIVVARTAAGELLGGVRVYPPTGDPQLGWWRGGRLVVRPQAPAGVGTALVRAACATAEDLGALRFDAEILPGNRRFFERLGWRTVRPVVAHGRAHLLVDWPIRRCQDLAIDSKSALGPLLAQLRADGGLGGPGYIGDDAVPVGAGGVVASVDAIVPSMVERDPEWAGWCGVLVGANDLAATGAQGTGLLDAVAGRDQAHVARVLRGLRRAAAAYRLPVLGGHTQLGVPAALSVTVFGTADRPVPGGGGRVGDVVHLTADLGGEWRGGYRGRQWDSTTGRSADELAAMNQMVAGTRPRAAKDVSMAGIVGTLGMLAEASGTGAELDVAAVPRPAAATAGDWFTCFPGYGMLTADGPGQAPAPAGPAVSAACGRLTAASGVQLRWPDGEVTAALVGGVTGLGRSA